MLTSTGNAASVYGYTGEMLDETGMQYLRARYYAPVTGRFVSKDIWEGDYKRPLSLNRWSYVEGNPVNYIDPHGLFITKSDIEQGAAVYSCNCGWIDLHHASPALANNIHKTIKTAQTLQSPKNTLGVMYRQSIMVIYVSQPVKRNIPYTPIYIEDIGYFANVAQGLTSAERWEVTLSLLMRLSSLRETASIVGGGGSHFSEEDLTSDVIGFNLAHYGYEDARTSDVSWKWLAQKCGFSTDRDIAKKQSLDIFEKYGEHETIKEWHKPRLKVNADVSKYLCEEGMCVGEREWPSDFKTVVPDKDNWSLYIPLKNDFLVPTGYENIYYSGIYTWGIWR